MWNLTLSGRARGRLQGSSHLRRLLVAAAAFAAAGDEHEHGEDHRKRQENQSHTEGIRSAAADGFAVP
jgi:hypothetical protein